MKRIAQKLFNAAITLLLVLSKDQAGEELRERKIVSTELGGVHGQHQRGQLMGHPHHPPWRFAGYHPALCSRSIASAQVTFARIFGGRDRALHSSFHFLYPHSNENLIVPTHQLM